MVDEEKQEAKALVLAERLEDMARISDMGRPPVHSDTKRVEAAELRRLTEAHDWQHRLAGERLRRIEVLEAENEALRRNAERYLWLREHGDGGCTEKDGYGGQTLRMGESLDVAVDEEIKGANHD